MTKILVTVVACLVVAGNLWAQDDAAAKRKDNAAKKKADAAAAAAAAEAEADEDDDDADLGDDSLFM